MQFYEIKRVKETAKIDCKKHYTQNAEKGTRKITALSHVKNEKITVISPANTMTQADRLVNTLGYTDVRLDPLKYRDTNTLVVVLFVSRLAG